MVLQPEEKEFCTFLSLFYVFCVFSYFAPFFNRARIQGTAELDPRPQRTWSMIVDKFQIDLSKHESMSIIIITEHHHKPFRQLSSASRTLQYCSNVLYTYNEQWTDGNTYGSPPFFLANVTNFQHRSSSKNHPQSGHNYCTVHLHLKL